MDNMEQQLSSILSNPQMMEKIAAMAQMLGQEHPPAHKEAPPRKDPSDERKGDAPLLSGFDPALLARLASMAGQTGIDQNQQALLQALTPYVSRDRVAKLENAMRAAKMARIASAFLNGGGLQLLTGR